MARIAQLRSAVTSSSNVISAIALAYVLLLVGAAWPNVWLFALGLIGTIGVDATRRPAARRALGVLSQVQLGVTPRWFIRNGAIALFAAREHLYPMATFVILVLGLLVAYGGHGLFLNLRALIDRRRRLSVPTMNIDVSALRIPDAPSSRLLRIGGNMPFVITVPLAAGMIVDKVAGVGWAAIVGLAIGLAVAVVVVIAMSKHAIRTRQLSNNARVTQVVHDEIIKLAPVVALYYAGGADTAYQVNMWLEAMANLSVPSLIMVRDRAQMASIGRTGLPVVCLSGNSEVMDFELPSLKVVLYTGNTGKNFNMLRDPDLKHVFIGHGDSDKVASANPVSKVYDEVWVAGRAGRDRYHRAQVGVRDEAIVEVGRPQLRTIAPAVADRRMFTVLYAPTWEGWTNDNLVSSLHILGVKLIKDLLERSPDIRVIYKPHPMTGIRNPKVKKAHEKIVAMIADANRRRQADAAWVETARAAKAERAAAKERLATLRAKVSSMAPSRSRDAAKLARDTSGINPNVHIELDRITAEQEDSFWVAAGWWTHQTISGAMPSLYSAFNQADIMISDISSVVSDFVASGKPYVVTNLHDVSDEQFRREQTAAGGAYLLGSDCAELDQILAAVQGPGPDEMLERRREVTTYLLGPSEPDSMTRFNDAVLALAARRDLEVAARQGGQQLLDTIIPAQSGHSGATPPQISAVTR